MENNSKRIAIIIVNWNGKHLLKSCLDSVFSQSYKNFETILVDNNSSDDSIDFVKKNYPKTKIISANENLGYTGGNNLGIKHALKTNFEYMLILNNDTKFGKNFLKEMVSAMRDDKKIGVIGPLIYNYLQGDKEKTVFFGYGNMNFKIGAPENLFQIDKNKVYEVDSLLGCAFFIRREVYEKIGLTSFKEFYMYWDDYDFLQRVKKAGFKIKFIPKIEINHICGASSKNINFPRTYYQTRNRFLLVKKYGKPLEKLCFYYYFALKFPFFILKQKNMRERYLVIMGTFDFIRKRFGKRTNFYFFETV